MLEVVLILQIGIQKAISLSTVFRKTSSSNYTKTKKQSKMKNSEIIKRLEAIEKHIGIANEYPKLEVGKWYLFTGHKVKNNPFMLITSIGHTNATFKGFDFQGKWTNSDYYSLHELYKNGYREATNQEVEEALIKEAEKRGFLTIGNKFESTISDSGQIREIDNFICFDGTKNKIELKYLNGSLYYDKGIKCTRGLSSNPRIYSNGEWVKIIEVDKFAELKEAHRNGAVIQIQNINDGYWTDLENPTWTSDREYRIKPKEGSKVGDVCKFWDHDEDDYAIHLLGAIDKHDNDIPFMTKDGLWYYNAKTLTKQEAIKLLFGDE